MSEYTKIYFPIDNLIDKHKNIVIIGRIGKAEEKVIQVKNNVKSLKNSTF
ncbi:hypothetical protein ACFQZ1_08785 [Bacillus sp. CGMCC 1.60114]